MSLVLMMLMIINLVTPALAGVGAAVGAQGGSYFTDDDNWNGDATGSGVPDSSNKNMDLKIGNTGDSKYPINFKITGVDKQPQKDVYLLVRALDVDEYDGTNGTGEWDRVYFSDNPADIQLGAPYTNWPSNFTNGDYRKEFPNSAYVGALSGNNDKWNTTVLNLDPSKITSASDYYVGLSTHHYYKAGSFNGGWIVQVDWGQLIIDGGNRESGEITKGSIKIENGKLKLDTAFIPKVSGNFDMEVSLIKQVPNGDGGIDEQNLDTETKRFNGSTAGVEKPWAGIELGSNLNPADPYFVNIILFDDRGGNAADEPNPGKAQHLFRISTFDPLAGSFNKQGLQYEPIAFTPNEFETNYFKVNGEANGTQLQKVKIVTLPDASKGKLVIDNGTDPVTDVAAGLEINKADLGTLKFIPASGEPGFTGSASFKWNGYDSKQYAFIDADITIKANAAPTIDPIVKDANKGVSVPFTQAEFANSYADTETAPLNKVKFVTLPDPDKGKLVLVNGASATDVTQGQEIPASQLGQLQFIPNAGQAGTVTFDWNGSDGTQYARTGKTVTIQINNPPVIQSISKTGLTGAVIPFSSADFALAPSYTDLDADVLSQVKITLPNNFDSLGKLWYTSVSGAVYISPGTTAALTKAQLDSLKFHPSPGLPNGGTVTFDWTATDGKQYSENPARVNIAYNGVPVAQPISVSAEEGSQEITIVLKGADMESVTGLVYGIKSQPAKGTLEPAASNNPYGNTWIYKPNPGFTGEDSFTFTVTDSDGQKSQPATVNIKVNKTLDGWAGGKPQGDTRAVKIIPGYVLPLAAVSSTDAAEVIATVNGTQVPLTLANPATYAADGYKKWETATFILPEGTAKGEYTVSFAAKAADQTVLPAEPAAKLGDNKFLVPGPAILDLQANPDKLLGDGKSTTVLTTSLKDDNGVPVAGVEVVFSAPEGTGSFVGSDRAITDSQGNASVTFKSQKITGTAEQKIPVKATVLDTQKGLKGQDQIEITFLPPTISGVLTKGGTHEPVAGATVRVTLDLNGDGKIEQGVDFDQTIVTQADGSYSLPVPEGDREYNLEFTQMVTIGGVETPVTYSQKAQVGKASGSGNENFDSEKTVTGIVLVKKPDGSSSLFDGSMVSKMKVYLKDPAGNYISQSEDGTPTGFELQGQGVFNANGLTKDTVYTLEIRFEVAPGQELIIQRGTVKVTADGEMNISQELVDPYGHITDAYTKQPIEGAQVMLYYADTQRNKDKGLVPGTGVVLPVLEDFPPHNNKSPEQLSDKAGFYAYMVYPETDYYLVVTKAGYEQQTSEIISVEREIVKRDFALIPRRSSGHSSSGGAVIPAKPEVTLALSVDKNLIKEGDQTTITVDYKNLSSTTLDSGEIKVTLPEGAELVSADGGTLDGKTITWKVANVQGGQAGSYKVVVKWPMLTAANTEFEIPGQFAANGNTADPVQADSSVKLNVFSDRFGALKHQRYILGYPDGQFKPDNSLTRAELAAIVARLTENDKVDGPLSYSDVQEQHWAANYVKIATKHGYFGGFEDGSFRPEAQVTRGELASVMARFLELKSGAAGEAHFSDVQGHWAADAIEALYRGKFLSGYPDGTFKPQDHIRRVEAVTMINRMLYRGPLKGMPAQFPDVAESHWGFGDVQEATVSHESSRNNDGSETYKSKIEDHVQ
ncbi:S-layer homology domain-containing protein [Paenibacillus sp. NPDC056579]|uniref:S-layer homology domain-containing protein n=1 Tax=Paenibacillus sp. NPDC056579 TaxID=3345871 RepID=UPI00367A83F8